MNRELLWEILRKYGCPPKLVSILCQFHEGMVARVTLGGQESEPFRVSTGVRQDCVLAPVLFNIFLMCVTSLLHKELQKNSGVTVNFRLDGNLFNIRRLQATTKATPCHILELQYSDDCAIVAHTPEDLQCTLSAIAAAYKRMGLSVNIPKTEVLSQWNTSAPSQPPQFTIHGNTLPTVTQFKYLGSILSQNNSIDEEVQNRLKQASTSFGHLKTRVFLNSNLNITTKVAVYQAICITTLLYSCEAWVTYSRHIKLLENFHIKCLQQILGISWRDRVPHTEVLQRTNSTSIETIIMKHQLRWLGHVTRMPSG